MMPNNALRQRLMEIIRDRCADDPWSVDPDEFYDRVVDNLGSYLEDVVPADYRTLLLADLDPQQRPDLLQRWLETPSVRNLFLTGPIGTGKTFSAWALVNEHMLHRFAESVYALSPSVSPVYSVPELLNSLNPRRPGYEERLDAVSSRGLIVLDDLAAAWASNAAREALYIVVNRRSQRKLRTIVTTNATWDDLVEMWGAPTMDRLKDDSFTWTITGASRRSVALTDWT